MGIMEIVLMIVWIIVTTLLYMFVCRLFGVIHLSFQSMFCWWFGCLVATALIFGYSMHYIEKIFS